MTNIWGSPTVTLSAPKEISLATTSNNQQISIVMEGATIELQPDNGPNSLTQVLSFRLPINIPDQKYLIGFVQDITFGITKSSDVRVLIIADLSGTVKTFESGFSDFTENDLNQPLRVERFFSVQGLEKAGGGILGVGNPVPDYEATLIITVQRLSSNGRAIVSIDSLGIDVPFL